MIKEPKQKTLKKIPESQYYFARRFAFRCQLRRLFGLIDVHYSIDHWLQVSFVD